MVVKALGGEAVTYPADSILLFQHLALYLEGTDLSGIPDWHSIDLEQKYVDDCFDRLVPDQNRQRFNADDLEAEGTVFLAAANDAVRLVPGSSWGTFTIACTIPIALFVGLYMYKIRPGKVARGFDSSAAC